MDSVAWLRARGQRPSSIIGGSVPVEQSSDPEKFAAFELSGWQTNIGGYKSAFCGGAGPTPAPQLDAGRGRGGPRGFGGCFGPSLLSARALEAGGGNHGVGVSLVAGAA